MADDPSNIVGQFLPTEEDKAKQQGQSLAEAIDVAEATNTILPAPPAAPEVTIRPEQLQPLSTQGGLLEYPDPELAVLRAPKMVQPGQPKPPTVLIDPTTGMEVPTIGAMSPTAAANFDAVTGAVQQGMEERYEGIFREAANALHLALPKGKITKIWRQRVVEPQLLADPIMLSLNRLAELGQSVPSLLEAMGTSGFMERAKQVLESASPTTEIPVIQYEGQTAGEALDYALQIHRWRRENVAKTLLAESSSTFLGNAPKLIPEIDAALREEEERAKRTSFANQDIDTTRVVTDLVAMLPPASPVNKVFSGVSKAVLGKIAGKAATAATAVELDALAALPKQTVTRLEGLVQQVGGEFVEGGIVRIPANTASNAVTEINRLARQVSNVARQKGLAPLAVQQFAQTPITRATEMVLPRVAAEAAGGAAAGAMMAAPALTRARTGEELKAGLAEVAGAAQAGAGLVVGLAGGGRAAVGLAKQLKAGRLTAAEAAASTIEAKIPQILGGDHPPVAAPRASETRAVWAANPSQAIPPPETPLEFSPGHLEHADPGVRAAAADYLASSMGDVQVGVLHANNPKGVLPGQPSALPVFLRDGRLMALTDQGGVAGWADVTNSLSGLNLLDTGGWEFSRDPFAPVDVVLWEEGGKARLRYSANGTAELTDNQGLWRRLAGGTGRVGDDSPALLLFDINFSPPVTDEAIEATRSRLGQLEQNLGRDILDLPNLARAIEGEGATDQQVAQRFGQLLGGIQEDFHALDRVRGYVGHMDQVAASPVLEETGVAAPVGPTPVDRIRQQEVGRGRTVGVPASVREAMGGEPARRGMGSIIQRMATEMGWGNFEADPEKLQLVQEFMRRVGPELFDDVILEIHKGAGAGVLGEYQAGVVRLMREAITRSGDWSTPLVHELGHHLETYLPKPIRAAITADYERAIRRFIKKNPWYETVRRSLFQSADKSGFLLPKGIYESLLKEYPNLAELTEQAGIRIAPSETSPMLQVGFTTKKAYALVNQREWWAIAVQDVATNRLRTELGISPTSWTARTVAHAKYLMQRAVDLVRGMGGAQTAEGVTRDLLEGKLQLDPTVSQSGLGQGTAFAVKTEADMAKFARQHIGQPGMKPSRWKYLTDDERFRHLMLRLSHFDTGIKAEPGSKNYLFELANRVHRMEPKIDPVTGEVGMYGGGFKPTPDQTKLLKDNWLAAKQKVETLGEALNLLERSRTLMAQGRGARVKGALTYEQLGTVLEQMGKPEFAEGITAEDFHELVRATSPKESFKRFFEAVNKQLGKGEELSQEEYASLVDAQDKARRALDEAYDLTRNTTLDEILTDGGGTAGPWLRGWRWFSNKVEQNRAVLEGMATRWDRTDSAMGFRQATVTPGQYAGAARSGELERAIYPILMGDHNSGMLGYGRFERDMLHNLQPIFELERVDSNFGRDVVRALEVPESVADWDKMYDLGHKGKKILGKGQVTLREVHGQVRKVLDQVMIQAAQAKATGYTYDMAVSGNNFQRVRELAILRARQAFGDEAENLIGKGFFQGDDKAFLDVVRSDGFKALVRTDKRARALRRIVEGEGLTKAWEHYGRAKRNKVMWERVARIMSGDEPWPDNPQAEGLPIRKDYFPHKNFQRLFEPELLDTITDPAGTYAYLSDDIRVDYLKRRQKDELGFDNLTAMLAAYIPAMGRMIYLEPALKRAIPLSAELPMANRLCAGRWMQALRGIRDPDEEFITMVLADARVRNARAAEKLGQKVARQLRGPMEDNPLRDRINTFGSLAFMGAVRPSSLMAFNALEMLYTLGATIGQAGPVRNPGAVAKHLASFVVNMGKAPTNLLAGKQMTSAQLTGALSILGDSATGEWQRLYSHALGSRARAKGQVLNALWTAQYAGMRAVDWFERSTSFGTFERNSLIDLYHSVDVRQNPNGTWSVLNLVDAEGNLAANPTQFPGTSTYATETAARTASMEAIRAEAAWWGKYMTDLIYSDYSKLQQSPWTRGGYTPLMFQLKRYTVNKWDYFIRDAQAAMQFRKDSLTQKALHGIMPESFSRWWDGWIETHNMRGGKLKMGTEPGRWVGVKERAALEGIGATEEEIGQVVAGRPTTTTPDWYPQDTRVPYEHLVGGISQWPNMRLQDGAIQAARRRLIWGQVAPMIGMYGIANATGLDPLQSVPWMGMISPAIGILNDASRLGMLAARKAAGRLDTGQQREYNRLMRDMPTRLIPLGAVIRDYRNERGRRGFAPSWKPAVRQGIGGVIKDVWGGVEALPQDYWKVLATKEAKRLVVPPERRK